MKRNGKDLRVTLVVGNSIGKIAKSWELYTKDD